MAEKNRPMPEDPRELAKAMFRQADRKMFGGVKADAKVQEPAPKYGKKKRKKVKKTSA